MAANYSQTGWIDFQRICESALDRIDSSEGNLDTDDGRCAANMRQRLRAMVDQIDSGEESRRLSPLTNPLGIWLGQLRSCKDDPDLLSDCLSSVADAAAIWVNQLTDSSEVSRAGAESVASQFFAPKGWLGITKSVQLTDDIGSDLSERIEDVDTSFRQVEAGLQSVVDRPSREVGIGNERFAAAQRFWIGASVDPRTLAKFLASELALTMRISSSLPTHRPVVVADSEIIRRGTAWSRQIIDAELPVPEFVGSSQIPGIQGPMYFRPSLDNKRAGRVIIPDSVSNWAFEDRASAILHEGPPGHHLQFSIWNQRLDDLSLFQVSMGAVPVCTEGWAIWAERQAAEDLLGPAGIVGFERGYVLRLIRAIIDVSFHANVVIDVDQAPFLCETVEDASQLFVKLLGLDSNRARREALRVISTPAHSLSYVLGYAIYRDLLPPATDVDSRIGGALRIGALGGDDLVSFLSQKSMTSLEELISKCAN